MCKECGCGLDSPTPTPAHAHPQAQTHSHPHSHAHPHTHPPAHSHSPDDSPQATRTLQIQQPLLDRNDRLAEQNRGFFRAKKFLVLNILSSPGSGKTTLIRETARRLQGRLRTGVIVGDLATDNDAARLRAANIPVVQITTGTLCHLEAGMIAHSLDQLPLDQLDLLIIENVGNLVCPAAFDLGENLRAVLLSVTEGEDKPLKYPPAFHSAHAALITKSDLAVATGFDRPAALANLQHIAHHAQIFETSARTGEGLDNWTAWLVQQHQELLQPTR